MLDGHPSVEAPGILIEGEDYYWEGGLMVMTATYHKKRGSCCGSRCKWCPFEPKYESGATQLALDPGASESDYRG